MKAEFKDGHFNACYGGSTTTKSCLTNAIIFTTWF